MEVLICDTYEDLSKAAFKVMKDVLDAKPDAVLGLATGRHFSSRQVDISHFP